MVRDGKRWIFYIYVNVTDHYEESIDLYGLNLKLRQYLHDETLIKADLVDQDIKIDNIHDEFPSLFDTISIDESINEHRLLLALG